MKKKILSISLSAALALSCTAAVMAEDNTPAVYVNGSEIYFEDQSPVILGEGTTLVPARGVFEAMGATVEWDGDKRLVEVTSSDNMTIIRLTIDDSTMRTYDMSGMMSTLLMGQDFTAPETEITLDVAPQIINDRTMIPLRAISEALNANVAWDGDTYTIDISTGAEVADGAPALSLSADTLTAAEGETVTLYIDAANIPEGTFVSGVTATVKYDADKFEYVEAVLMNGDTSIDGALGVANAEFADDYVKAVFVTIDSDVAATTDGHVMKLTFKSLTGEEGSFSLSNGYHSRLGYNTSLLVNGIEEAGSATFEGDDLAVDTTEVVINSADAVDTTDDTDTDAVADDTAADTDTEDEDTAVTDTDTEDTDAEDTTADEDTDEETEDEETEETESEDDTTDTDTEEETDESAE
ncbi:MAG: hypothetical protein LUF26_09210 [Firmicutes bacterium]|nr:hypothetical protein [Bacillota bacterium]